MRWTFGLRETNAELADVKSCGPGAPMLVSSCPGADPGGDQVARKTRCTEEITILGFETVARGMPVVRSNLWYLPPSV